MAEDGPHLETADVQAIDEAVARSSGSAGFGLTAAGFVPKSFARLLAEKLALAEGLLGPGLDLGSGSALRKILEVSALEDARTWAALNAMYDNGFVSTAAGDALSRHGEELGLTRPFAHARGEVQLVLKAPGLAPDDTVEIPRGARMVSTGGHHASTDETVVLSATIPQRTVAVEAFYPGPEHNLVPAQPAQTLRAWNRDDPALEDLLDRAPAVTVDIVHTAALTGGELQWPDVRYRELLLRAPRSTWTAEAIEMAASLVPGVRQVLVKDAWGGLDIHKSTFGNFNFMERVFSSERDLGTPYYLTVLVAPTQSAIWPGPEGLRAAVETAIEDLRPISIFPRVELAAEVGIGVTCDLVVEGIPLPTGPRDVVNASDAAQALKARLMARLRRYVDALALGAPVRSSEIVWALMSEPGIADVRGLRLLRHPPGFDRVDVTAEPTATAPEQLDCGENAELGANEVAELVERPDDLRIA